VSYWEIRPILEQSLGTWTIQLAESRVNTIAAEIIGTLRSLEQEANLIVQTNLEESTVPLLQTLMAQKSEIHAIAARLSTGSKSIGLGGDDGEGLLSHCQVSATSNYPFWTAPYQLSPSNPSFGITYCLSLQQRQNIVAIELTLHWLKPLVTRKLSLVSKFYQLEMPPPFVIAPQTGQGLVGTSASMQKLLQSANLRHRLAANNSGPQVLEDSSGILVTTSLPPTSWIIGIAIPNTQTRMFAQKFLWLIIGSMTKDMILMCVAIALVSRQTTRSLRALLTSTEDIAQGNLDTTLIVVTQHDEVGRLAKAFRQMRDALKIYIQELQETTAAKQKMESELSIAAQIQRSMVPKIEVASSSHPRHKLSALFQPARVVGGDFYDFFALGNDCLCFVIGDVADKGVAAALLMARTITLLRTVAKPTSTPVEILCALNDQLCTNNDECLFVTLFCGVLDLNTGALTYASSGHDLPLLVRDRCIQSLDLETGPPLGLEEEALFPQGEFLLQPDDLILLYTDGITEAMNPDGELFSETRLIDLLTFYPPANPAQTIRLIQYFYRQFVAQAPQSDDLTILVLQYQPSSPFSQDMDIVEWTLTINSKLTELERVSQHLAEILKAESIAVENIEDTLLIVEEVLVNIIQHGYDNKEHQRIDLQVKISTGILRMVFEDWGKPFNPLREIATPDLSIDDEQRASGGLGFYLVRELADQVDYLRQDNKNILTIRKNLK